MLADLEIDSSLCSSSKDDSFKFYYGWIILSEEFYLIINEFSWIEFGVWWICLGIRKGSTFCSSIKIFGDGPEPGGTANWNLGNPGLSLLEATESPSVFETIEVSLNFTLFYESLILAALPGLF